MGGINHEHEGINRPNTESGRVGSNVDTAFSSTNTILPILKPTYNLKTFNPNHPIQEHSI